MKSAKRIISAPTQIALWPRSKRKRWVLARITEADAANKAVDWALTDRIVPQYNVGEYAIVTERGHEYRLGPMTMGDSARGIADFMKSGKDCLSLEAAHTEAKRRSMIPKVDREKVIDELMRLPEIPRPTETPARALLDRLCKIWPVPGNIPANIQNKSRRSQRSPIA